MRSHITIVGVIHMVLGILGLLGGLVGVLALLGAGAIGGIAAGAEGELLGAMIASGTMGIIALVVLGCILVASLPSLVGGYGLLTGKKWGPAVALVASLFQVFNAPIGTGLAIYTAWVTLSEEGQREYGLLAG